MMMSDNDDVNMKVNMNADTDAALEAQMQRVRQQLRPAAFRTGFRDRVMVAIATESLAGVRRDSFGRVPTDAAQPPANIADALPRVFARLAPLAAAAALVLATMNFVGTRATGQPIVERVLGLPTVTLAAAYTLDTDLGLTGGSQQ